MVLLEAQWVGLTLRTQPDRFHPCAEAGTTGSGPRNRIERVIRETGWGLVS
jgi:hypothetical protein